MKIDNKQLNTPIVTAGSLLPNAEKKEVSAKVEKSAAEKVTISSQFLNLQSLGSDVAKADTFDAKKVDAIRAAIADGNFNVDVAKTADGLINAAKDFLSK
jgi:negative regulator of flagellin synthesis FlgM